MTTAARPTFEPARARGDNDLGKLSKQYSARDLPGHTKLKYRQEGQNAPTDTSARDFRRDLDERERSSYREKNEKRSSDRSRDSHKRQRLSQIPAANLDADDPADSDSESDSDSEDDTAELLAELNRIKKERAEEAAKKELEKKEEEARIRTENILSGNPLMNMKRGAESNFAVKRRWDDDVVFKNCARGEPDKTQKRFINDTLRSEFHKKFMDKYVK